MQMQFRYEAEHGPLYYYMSLKSSACDNLGA
jgi:hypothetical protein